MSGATPVDEDVQMVTFRVGGQEFALNVFEVERVLRYRDPTPLPDAPDFLEGMLSYGESAIPVIDLRTRLSVPAETTGDTRIMVLEWEQGRIGLIVDAVVTLLRVPVEDIAMPPPLVRGLAAEYLNGIIHRDDTTILVLAVGRLLTSTEQMALETLTAEHTHD